MMSKALDDFVCWQAKRLVGYGVALSLRDFMGQEAWQFTIYMKDVLRGLPADPTDIRSRPSCRGDRGDGTAAEATVGTRA